MNPKTTTFRCRCKVADVDADLLYRVYIFAINGVLLFLTQGKKKSFKKLSFLWPIWDKRDYICYKIYKWHFGGICDF